jgi:hypothetical protein
VPEHPACDCVAPTVVPDVVTVQDGDALTVNPVAVAQLSLVNGTGVVTQSEKVPWSLAAE